MIQQITVAVLAALAGWCWGYGFGSRHTRETYERIVQSYKDAAASTWARLVKSEQRIGRLRLRLAGKYIVDRAQVQHSGDEPI